MSLTNYKGFDLIDPGTAPGVSGWGGYENDLQKEMIDTLVMDCVPLHESNPTNGHRHNKLYKDDGTSVLFGNESGVPTVYGASTSFKNASTVVINPLGNAQIGTSTSHRLSIMTNNANRIIISSTGFLGFGGGYVTGTTLSIYDPLGGANNVKVSLNPGSGRTGYYELNTGTSYCGISTEYASTAMDIYTNFTGSFRFKAAGSTWMELANYGLSILTLSASGNRFLYADNSGIIGNSSLRYATTGAIGLGNIPASGVALDIYNVFSPTADTIVRINPSSTKTGKFEFNTDNSTTGGLCGMSSLYGDDTLTIYNNAHDTLAKIKLFIDGSHYFAISHNGLQSNFLTGIGNQILYGDGDLDGAVIRRGTEPVTESTGRLTNLVIAEGNIGSLQSDMVIAKSDIVTAQSDIVTLQYKSDNLIDLISVNVGTPIKGSFTVKFPPDQEMVVYYQKYDSNIVRLAWGEVTGMTSMSYHVSSIDIPTLIRPVTFAFTVILASAEGSPQLIVHMDIKQNGSIELQSSTGFTHLYSGCGLYKI